MPAAALAVGGIGSIVGGVMGASSASKAAKAQADAANHAADLQHQDAQAALDFQRQMFGVQQQNIAPWMNVGKSGLVNLASLLGIMPRSSRTTASGGNALPATGTAPNNFTGSTIFNGDGSVAGSTTGASTAFNPSLPGPMAANGNPAQSTVPLNSLVNPQSTTLSSAINGPDGLMTANGTTVTPFSDGTAASTTGDSLALNPGTVPGADGSMTSLDSLVNPDLGASGSLMAPWTKEFKAPTDVTEQNDPGFQFRLQQGQQALERSAAARGTLLTGGTAKALQQQGQDYASNEYGNVYNRSLTEYQQSYNQFQQNQANQFNRLASIAGMGQVSAGQLNSTGTSAANNVGNILLGSGAQIGQDLNNAGAARASGYVGSSNALSNMFGNLGGLVSLYSLLGKQGAPAAPVGAV